MLNKNHLIADSTFVFRFEFSLTILFEKIIIALIISYMHACICLYVLQFFKSRFSFLFSSFELVMKNSTNQRLTDQILWWTKWIYSYYSLKKVWRKDPNTISAFTKRIYYTSTPWSIIFCLCISRNCNRARRKR